MLRGMALVAALTIGFSGIAAAASVEKSLAKLAPEIRAQQACGLHAMREMRKQPSLKRADRVQPSSAKPAVLQGAKLVAKGGAVRAAGRWYAVDFTCDMTPDLLKATTFTYVLGKEIPESDWERLGLWR